MNVGECRVTFFCCAKKANPTYIADPVEPDTTATQTSTNACTSSVTNTSKGGWKWETSAFRYMLAYNDGLRTDYKKFLTVTGKQYPYFVVGMKVWKGKATPTDYQDKPISKKLAKAVEVLRNGMNDPNAETNANLDAFVESVKSTLTTSDIEADRIKATSTKGSKLNRARFVRAFFLGLWHLERQEYQESQDVIKEAFQYKYDSLMNNFTKQLIGYGKIKSAITDLEHRLEKVD